MAFEKEIKEYEDLRGKYQTLIINKMDREEYIKYNEVLFSIHFIDDKGLIFSSQILVFLDFLFECHNLL